MIGRGLARVMALTCLALASGGATAECGCLWQGSFSEVQAETALVVSARVISAKGNSIDLAISQRLRGEEDLSEIRVWLKAADYCRPEPALFPVGGQWVMALHRITALPPGGFNPNTPNVSYGRVGDYSLSNCGGYWLSQTENLVSGNLIDAPRWVREPQMTPVLLSLLEDYVAGRVGPDALREATRVDPALRELMLDTRSFLREN